ncbi:hypothetical protein AB0M02_27420 [Actinoplanes sp. NPDC051861]|uniref:hypothetical protein n=1 Tax=Actinoplanes sp. NPDC051861 TaxID=3155170 RepID=UPI00343D8684
MSRRFCSVLAVLVVLLVTPGRAHAGLMEYVWPPVSICTQAQLGGAYMGNASPYTFEFTGVVSACPGADDPQARWTVAQYRNGGSSWLAARKPYGEAGVRFLFKRYTYSLADTWAACVVNHAEPSAEHPGFFTVNRVACIGRDPAGGTVGVPIPIDDPRFDGVPLIPGGSGWRPACGSCV